MRRVLALATPIAVVAKASAVVIGVVDSYSANSLCGVAINCTVLELSEDRRRRAK